MSHSFAVKENEINKGPGASPPPHRISRFHPWLPSQLERDRREEKEVSIRSLHNALTLRSGGRGRVNSCSTNEGEGVLKSPQKLKNGSYSLRMKDGIETMVSLCILNQRAHYISSF